MEKDASLALARGARRPRAVEAPGGRRRRARGRRSPRLLGRRRGSPEQGQASAPEPAERPRPLPLRARAPESCVKATPEPRSRCPAARPTDCGTSSLLSAPEKDARPARIPAIRHLGRAGRTGGSPAGARASPLVSPQPEPRLPPAGPVTTPAPGRRRARPLPEKQPGSRGSTRGRAAALRPCPPHLRSASAPHLLAGSARPVGARTDPRAGTLPVAVTRDATATVAFASSAQAPAASRRSRSEPRRG